MKNIPQTNNEKSQEYFSLATQRLSSHFLRKEFVCHGMSGGGGHAETLCGYDFVDVLLIDVLENVRDHFDKPIIITSGCRCPTHNKSVGGSLKSQHILGKAADFRVIGVSVKEVADYLETKYPSEYGIGRYNGRIHVDVRNGDKARWNSTE